MTHQPDGNKDYIIIELRTDQGEDEVLVDGERLEEGHSDGTETVPARLARLDRKSS